MIEHHNAKIASLKGLENGSCVAVLAARTEADYLKILVGMTREGCMEMQNGESEYGFWGRFICPPEKITRNAFRKVKMSDIDYDDESMAIPYRKIRRWHPVKCSNPQGFHKSWEMSLETAVLK